MSKADNYTKQLLANKSPCCFVSWIIRFNWFDHPEKVLHFWRCLMKAVFLNIAGGGWSQKNECHRGIQTIVTRIFLCSSLENIIQSQFSRQFISSSFRFHLFSISFALRDSGISSVLRPRLEWQELIIYYFNGCMNPWPIYLLFCHSEYNKGHQTKREQFIDLKSTFTFNNNGPALELNEFYSKIDKTCRD